MAAFLLPVLTGCADLGGLQRDIADYERSLTRVRGEVRYPGCADCALLVVPVNAKGHALSYKVVERQGPVEFLMSSAAHTVFVFDDRNHNLQFDGDEPFAWHAVTARNPLVDGLVFELKDVAQAGPPVAPKGSLFALRTQLIEGIQVQLGTVVSLEDPRFLGDMASRGMWRPLSFMRDGVAGIYFLNSYDPKRTPVLFVHGMNGSPRDFDALATAIDTTKYQPWFFYYPTGLDLGDVATGMRSMLEELRLDTGFKDLHLVAHSMGGLPTRQLLNTCENTGQCEFIRSFTSVSSPFSGSSAVRAGEAFSPVVMPVWRNLNPDGPFLTELFAHPTSPLVEHHMVFGFRNSGVGTVSSDGTVELQSQLPVRAQRQARSVLGLDEDHLSILRSPMLAEHLQVIWTRVTPGAISPASSR